jgi:7-cyano-7-deazaguanine tRNA-ribosyltransferase
MSFEIRERDLLARIGRLKTKSGILETPAFLPVINPTIQPISPQTISQEYGCKGFMTNAYIIQKRLKNEALKMGVHNLLGFNGVIMTDSGGYQVLVYGDVKTTNEEIVHFQENIQTDIATILDVPTGWGVSQQYARHTVNETFKSAKEWEKMKTLDDVAWIGPIQGGHYLNLIAKSAKKMGKLPFQIHALGSPTPVMERYLFDTLVDMILTAKQHLPFERPLHLFGAGHPFMFSLAIALGCDLFDSAAYAIYAREDRYMTESSTSRMRELHYFPCSCPVCARSSPENVLEMPKTERQNFLAKHNLYVCFSEIRRIKQAIVEGRLWEHLQMRAHGHSALLQGLKRLEKYSDYLEKSSPVSKPSGLSFYDYIDLFRPEVVRHRKRLLERYSPPKEATILLLLPQVKTKPFHKSKELTKTLKMISQKLGDKVCFLDICTYAAPFGIIPIQIDETYPMSQYEIGLSLDNETINYVAMQVANYISNKHYEQVILLDDVELWKKEIALACRKISVKKKFSLTLLRDKEPWSESMLSRLVESVEASVSEKI